MPCPARLVHQSRVIACALLLALCTATGFAAAEARQVPDTMAERMRACTPCHGNVGVTTREGYFPTIAGKPAGYLYNQLLNFREGRRHNATMGVLFDHLNDAYLREIAAHFASLALPATPSAATPGTASPAQLARGAQLVSQGDRASGIPACASCHGAALTGVAPSVPGLLGLPQAYVVAQLAAWRDGQRRTLAPDCMAQISRRLGASDLSAVAAYLARQPLPSAGKPALAFAAAPTMDCAGPPR